MITIGSQIIYIKTNTLHTVDGIEVINHKTLVFTKDTKCFPIEEVMSVESYYKTQKEVNASEQYVYSVIDNLVESGRNMTLGEWAPKYYVPRVKKIKKTVIGEIWDKIIKKFTSSND